MSPRWPPTSGSAGARSCEPSGSTASRSSDSQWLHTSVQVLGVDETAFLAATPVSSTQYVTGLVDLRPAGGGSARLLDVVPGRTGKVVNDWLEDRGPDWCASVRVAALDRRPEAATRESRMRGNAHVRFGRRPGETDPS